MGKKKTIQEQLWDRVKIDSNGCRNWLGSKIKQGYGRVHFKREMWLAHRLAWFVTYGNIPSGICVLHRCDNPGCINLDHLFLGTRRDNMQDMISKKRQRYSFILGHLYSAKLTPNQAKEIRILYANGNISQYQLAKKYGLTRSGIQRILNKTTWRNI